MQMKRFAVIGLGRFGLAVVKALYEMGAEVIAIDKNKQLVNEAQATATHAIALDATNENLLLDQGVDKVDCAVVGIGENFEANVLVTSIMREFGINVIITRAYNPLQKAILRKIGATQVLSPEEDIGSRLAKSLVREEIVDFLELPEGYSVKLVPVPKKMTGRTLAEAKIRNKFMIDVVVIKRKILDEKSREVTPKVIVIPDGNEVLEEGDVLGVIGKDDDIERFT